MAPAEGEVESEEEEAVAADPAQGQDGVDVTYGAEAPRKSLEDCLDQLRNCEKVKEIAVGAYKSGDVERALELWTTTEAQLQDLISQDAFKAERFRKEAEQVAELEKLLHLNLAQAHLKTGAFSTATSFCDRVLERDPGNAKALYRKASAQLVGSDFAGARATAQLLLSVDENNAAVRTLLADVARKEHQSKEKGKKAAKRMLAGMERDPRSKFDTEEGG
eukprot:CAMPEP_0170594724 /NCGR_PEP_ID=MMETSP0224-20130122/14158_1 /TAXON_ID=285029 /ORGANISM="Togula jolla, Strain CCCM 725" /LENGTH=219 /DNA_ID=CAMNT_0010918811 /DNA_START=51 /DNA_END=707 /DNA_ORIENTATION=+